MIGETLRALSSNRFYKKTLPLIETLVGYICCQHEMCAGYEYRLRLHSVGISRLPAPVTAPARRAANNCGLCRQQQQQQQQQQQRCIGSSAGDIRVRRAVVDSVSLLIIVEARVDWTCLSYRLVAADCAAGRPKRFRGSASRRRRAVGGLYADRRQSRRRRLSAVVCHS
jgi:hypothetical protein